MRWAGSAAGTIFTFCAASLGKRSGLVSIQVTSKSCICAAICTTARPTCPAPQTQSGMRGCSIGSANQPPEQRTAATPEPLRIARWRRAIGRGKGRSLSICRTNRSVASTGWLKYSVTRVTYPPQHCPSSGPSG